jgi:hypothetical protein
MSAIGKLVQGFETAAGGLRRTLTLVATAYTFAFPPLVVLDCAANLARMSAAHDAQLAQREPASRPAS